MLVDYHHAAFDFETKESFGLGRGDQRNLGWDILDETKTGPHMAWMD